MAETEFAKLWAGQTVSLFGTQVTNLALPLTAVLVLHATPAQLGLLGAANWLPWLLIALWTGAWIDRRRRRLPVLIAADAVRAAVLLLVVLAALCGRLSVLLLIAAVFVLGLATVVFEIGYQAYLPTIVPTDRLMGANSRLAASASVAQVGGPGVGGLLVQLITAPYALIADAVSFAVSLVSLAWIRIPEPDPAPEPRRRGEIRDGLRITLGDPILRALIGTAASYNLFANWMIVLFSAYAIRDLGLTAGGIGLVLSVGAVGAVAGAALSGPVARRLGIGRALLWTIALECCALAVIPAAPAHCAATIPLLIAGIAFNGFGVALSSVLATSVRQSATPAHMLGRMTAGYRSVSFGVVTLGTLLGGFTGQLAGLRAAEVIGQAGLLTTIIWVAASPLRGLRQLPTLPTLPTPPTPLEPTVTATCDGERAPARV